MREIINNMEGVRERVERLRGTELKLLINRGRNKFQEFDGVIENLYPNVFTVKADEGDTPVMTFSYSDVMTKNIRFFPRNKNNKS